MHRSLIIQNHFYIFSSFHLAQNLHKLIRETAFIFFSGPSTDAACTSSLLFSKVSTLWTEGERVQHVKSS